MCEFCEEEKSQPDGRLTERYVPVILICHTSLNYSNASRKNLGRGIFTLKLGSCQHSLEYEVPRDLLLRKDPEFAAKLNLVNPGDRAVLPDDQPGIFEHYLDWLYHNHFDLQNFLVHIKVLSFTENHGMIKLTDTIMEMFLTALIEVGSHPRPDFAYAVYNHTRRKDSKLRLLFLRYFVHMMFPGEQDEAFMKEEGVTMDFMFSDKRMADTLWNNKELLDGVVSMLRATPRKDKDTINPIELPTCEYHQHGISEPCPYAEVIIKKEE